MPVEVKGFLEPSVAISVTAPDGTAIINTDESRQQTLDQDSQSGASLGNPFVVCSDDLILSQDLDAASKYQ